MGTKLFTIALGISSIMMIVIFFIGRGAKPISKESISEIIGDENVDKIKNAKHDEEMMEIIRNLPAKSREKLKSHFLSKDIRVAVKMMKKHIREEAEEGS